MDKIIIEGGHPLQGEIVISGAKNAALPLICATLLAPGPHVLENVPDLRDTRTMLALLEALGASWQREGTTLTIDTAGLHSYEASYDLVKTMRASVLVLGPLLARMGKARVSLPGGCAIGARPINFHLQGFQQLGVRHQLDQGYVEAEVDGRLRGNTVCFDIPSVTATENILMGAVLAKGETVIKNAAREPEIGNLVDMLNGMGAKIKGRGSDTLQIEGVTRLRPARISIVPDRIETGTFLIAVGATGGELTLSNCDPSLLPSLYEKLRAAGVEVREEQDRLHVARRGPLRAVDVKTMPYPGFPTDLQAQIMALMCLSNGLSLITETIFENRFMHVAELQRMGADIRIDGHSAIVSGTGKLRGAPVMATDLRASASLVIAGLAAEGITQISRVYHLDRGYDDLVGKLSRVGAVIHRERE
ncbi:UDP-N-acetylglucosamine 1-carboxyvinyltransferase [Desulfurivibrio alkaliphilus]|uniref:UDP-N-acetylglucosamine 1-carboxyvinyltransferase n=1 Tax=Desulfurivibrio alkaliphilus (strain DSM 19089 / UNIQEM U267 / AHT2) TaxID=589865 RepID=D6Z161_DESAT|nr:UDP-N-acetylglucosamine 1-carboxyvinyltransferase [Desulfurivibrio alkaliphilus]ADH85316.1 UDP-N-acetylglucosamine 1-carboxyvinyltransferase [Desulfurivibrio alkaliphilus AHT 2]